MNKYTYCVLMFFNSAFWVMTDPVTCVCLWYWKGREKVASTDEWSIAYFSILSCHYDEHFKKWSDTVSNKSKSSLSLWETLADFVCLDSQSLTFMILASFASKYWEINIEFLQTVILLSHDSTVKLCLLTNFNTFLKWRNYFKLENGIVSDN